MSKSKKKCESWADKSDWYDESDYMDDFFSSSQAKNKFKKEAKIRRNSAKNKYESDESSEMSALKME